MPGDRWRPGRCHAQFVPFNRLQRGKRDGSHPDDQFRRDALDGAP